MPHWLRHAAPAGALLFATTLGACDLGDGTAPPRARRLTSLVTSVNDSAVVGDVGVRWHDLTIEPEGPTGGDGRVDFIVTSAKSSGWLVLDPLTGSAPATYRIGLAPMGVAAGDHVDTVRFVGNRADDVPMLVPVRLRVLPNAYGTLSVSPTSLQDSVLVGSRALRGQSIGITFAGVGEGLNYWVHASLASHWIIVPGPQSGRANGSFFFQFDPSGRSAGVYVDTFTFHAVGGGAASVAVPLRFEILPCAVTDIGAVPLHVAGALTDADCTSPRFLQRYAKRYRFSATAGDSILIEVASNVWGEALALEREGVATPLVETQTCTNPLTVACVRYRHITETGNYILEVTTWGDRQEGAFTVDIWRPQAPHPTTGLEQFSPEPPFISLPAGGTIPRANIQIAGFVSDPDRDAAHMELEVRAVGTPFTGVATHVAPAGPGTRRAISVGGLVNGASYRWRVRTGDVTGRYSAWVEFGGNPSDDADFTVVVPPELRTPPTGGPSR